MSYEYLCGMFFKVSMRHNMAKGTNDCYYRLTEGYRNIDDRVCYRTLLNVGFLNGIVTIDQLNLTHHQLVEC
jgi:hypothetical protein